jgi:hypothetical protein
MDCEAIPFFMTQKRPLRGLSGMNPLTTGCIATAESLLTNPTTTPFYTYS